jgi:hypothetical protein
MLSLHPAIAAALVAVAPPSSFCHKLAAYHDLLSNLDWQYQFSDEHRIVKRGEELVARAHLLQAEVDPTGEIWNSYSGSRMHGAPQPKVVEVQS